MSTHNVLFSILIKKITLNYPKNKSERVPSRAETTFKMKNMGHTSKIRLLKSAAVGFFQRTQK